MNLVHPDLGPNQLQEISSISTSAAIVPNNDFGGGTYFWYRTHSTSIL